MSRDKQKTEPIKESFVRTLSRVTLSWFLKNTRRNQYGAKPIRCGTSLERVKEVGGRGRGGGGGWGIVPVKVLQKEAPPRSLTRFPFTYYLDKNAKAFMSK